MLCSSCMMPPFRDRLLNYLLFRSLLDPAASQRLLDPDGQLPSRILCWNIAVPQVNLRVQKLALFIMWISHYFDCPGWLELQIGKCCWEHESKWTNPRTKKTCPGTAHRDICFCFLSNCAATQGRLGTQAHALSYFLVIIQDGFHVAGDERVRSVSEVGVFPIMQITSKYLPHSIILAGPCLWILCGQAPWPPLHCI